MDGGAKGAPVPALFSPAVLPSCVHGAVFADHHAGKVVFFGVYLHWIDCGLYPRDTAIVGMRDQNLAVTVSQFHDPGDIQTIDPPTAHVGIHREPGFNGAGAWDTQSRGWLAPVGSVGGFLKGDEAASALAGKIEPGDVGGSL